MRIAQAYGRADIQDHWDAIVIGSGVGGLTTAALLARFAGQRVLVLERHFQPGGFTHVFRRPGWQWDVGVHYVGQVHSPQATVRRLFDVLTQGRLRWSPLPDVYDRIHIADRSYDLPSELQRLRQQLHEYFPKEGRALKGYFAAIQSVNRWIYPYMAEKVLPWPAWLGGPLRWPLLGWARRTTAEVLSSLTDNAELKAVLTGQWGDYGLPPGQSSFVAHALVASHYFQGAGYPVGGSSQIAASLVPTIEAVGGRVLVQAEVQSIVIERDRAVGVLMADGRRLRSPFIVSNAGAANTFGRLLPPELPLSQTVRAQLRKIPPSMGHLCLYAGVELLDGEQPPEGTNLWIYPGPDHDANVRQFMADPSQAFPVLFLSFPSRKDPTFCQRYPGRYTLEAVAPVPYSAFAAWEGTRWKRRGADYDRFKSSWEQRLVEGLQARLPQLRGRLAYRELSTPLSTLTFTAHPQGQIYGLSQVPQRFLQRWGPRTGLPGLFLSGSDACVSGVAGAAMGGVMAALALVGPALLRNWKKARE